MTPVIAAATLVVLLGSAAVAGAEPDRVIVPGERVGAVTSETSEAALGATYGAERVEPHLVEMGEGFVCHGSRIVLVNGDSLEVTWRDPQARAGAASVHVKGPAWTSTEGVRLGMALKELERLNRKPFRLAGFGWDYGGTVTSWAGGRLDRLDRGAGSGRLILRLAPDMTRVSRADMRRVMGDRDFSSGHPDMQKLNPRVYDLVVIFDRNAQCAAF